MSAKPARAKKTRASRQPSARHGEDVAIPDKLYFRIGEVARLCRVPAYVLRFWETEFPQLKPNKSSTGQRMYRRNEVEHALRIKHLLYREGFTIPGARQQLLADRQRDDIGIEVAGRAPQARPGRITLCILTAAGKCETLAARAARHSRDCFQQTKVSLVCLS